MIYALDVNNRTIRAEPKKYGICPLCESSCISKCGKIKVWHFAHKSNTSCDEFAEAESEWHLGWKLRFSDRQTEVIVRKNNQKHIADIKGGRVVLELQHSPISPEEIKKREDFYGDMIWLFDLTEKRNKEQFHIRHSKTDWYNKDGWVEVPLDGYITFFMDWGRKIYSQCKKPIFFDVGDTLIEVKKLYSSAKSGGWGYERDYSYLIDQINGY